MIRGSCELHQAFGVDRDCRYCAGLPGCWGLVSQKPRKPWCGKPHALPLRRLRMHRKNANYTVGDRYVICHERHNRIQNAADRVLYSLSRSVGRDNTTIDLDLLQQHHHSAARFEEKNHIHR